MKADGDSFRLKLSTQEIFDEWAKNAQQRNLGVSGRIFIIESLRSRTGRGTLMKLKVSFSFHYFFSYEYFINKILWKVISAEIARGYINGHIIEEEETKI